MTFEKSYNWGSRDDDKEPQSPKSPMALLTKARVSSRKSCKIYIGNAVNEKRDDIDQLNIGSSKFCST